MPVVMLAGSCEVRCGSPGLVLYYKVRSGLARWNRNKGLRGYGLL